MEYIKTCFSTSALSTISLPVTITELMASPAALCPSPPFHASSYSFFLALLFLSHFIFSRPVSFFPTVFISPLFLYPPPSPRRLRRSSLSPRSSHLNSSLLSLTPSVLSTSCLFLSLRVTRVFPGRSVRSAKVRQLKWQQIGTDWEKQQSQLREGL